MLKKTYLSREMTRAMSLDHPIGDPFGGPAYGEKRDPGSIAAAFSAVFTSGAVATVAAYATVATTIGMGLTVVGAITGSKDLMKLGGVLSLVGGVTGVAASMGAFGAENAIVGTIGEAAAVEGAVGTAATDSVAADQLTSNAVSGTTMDVTAGTLTENGVANSFAPPIDTVAGNAATATPIQTIAQPAANTSLIAPTNTVATQTAAPSMGDGSVAATADRLTGATAGANTAQNGLLSNAGATTNYANLTNIVPGQVPPTTSSGWLDKILASPTATMLGVQAVGSTASAFGNYLSAKDAQDRQDGLLAQQSYNMNAASRLYGRG